MLHGTKKMQNIRVAFILSLTDKWLGGVNYYRNLLKVIVENQQYNIVPIIFIGHHIDSDLFKDYPSVEVVKTDILTNGTEQWKKRKAIEQETGDDIVFYELLKSYRIDAISHITGGLGHTDFPAIGWIADFQHKYLPELFSKAEIESRDLAFEKLARECDVVIVSSHNAEKDYIKNFPAYKDKVAVLQFVACLEKASPIPAEINLHIPDKYFYLPNQYWVHKNHKVVLEALYLLKQEGKNVVVVSSGHIEDYRNKEHISELKRFIKEKQLEKSYYILGSLPYSLVRKLSELCVAFINPSLFEGWSTTVEEAKSLGKPIILSNIDVHKEQAPAYGVFFHPYDPKELADVMWKAWCGENTHKQELNFKLWKSNREREKEFAKCYSEIVLKAISSYNGLL